MYLYLYLYLSTPCSARALVLTPYLYPQGMSTAWLVVYLYLYLYLSTPCSPILVPEECEYRYRYPPGMGIGKYRPPRGTNWDCPHRASPQKHSAGPVSTQLAIHTHPIDSVRGPFHKVTSCNWLRMGKSVEKLANPSKLTKQVCEGHVRGSM